MSIPPRCEIKRKDKIITLSENKSKISLLNKKQGLIRQIAIDGCVVTDGERCDFLVIRESDGAEFFIELKGSDIKKACSQIERTLGLIRSRSASQTFCFVVSTRCPLTTTETQIQKLKFIRKLHAQLIIKNSPVEFDI